ncbi:MAG: 30S ribosomal protein S8 [Opitutales bacterium]|nr:30S ribosomal protein S8 [Opitutales bacterium]|tara:strand:+ start:532 stop:930 length:399 start_codon:yes stop_codon:yes gene_type:complete
MSVHDTIGDFITVIRNAGSVGKDICSYPHSKLRAGVGRILKKEGFIKGIRETDGDSSCKQLEIELKYVDGVHAIAGIKRESKPGCRRYCGYHEIPRVLEGLGVAILSTPKGVLDDVTARREKVGGELLCSVW